MLLSLLLIPAISAVLDCPKFVCSDSSSVSSTQCIGEDSNIYYLSPCQDLKNSYCPPQFILQNITCTTPPSTLNTAFPGESCTFNQDCLYGTCNNNQCYGQDYGGDCTNHGECNPGLRCDPGLFKCNILMDSTSPGCVSDFDCLPNMGCDAGYCVNYYSVPNGQWVNNCTNSLSSMCESGQCLYGLCISPLRSALQLPMLCSSQFQCVSKDLKQDGIEVYTNCTCGYGTKGNSYCRLFPGDRPYQKMLEARKEWIQTNISENCNTLRRWKKECILSHGSSSFAVLYEYLTMAAMNYPLLQEAESCVIQIVYSDYYQDLEELNSYAEAVMVAGIIFNFL